MSSPRQGAGTSVTEAVLIAVIYAVLIAGYFVLAVLIG